MFFKKKKKEMMCKLQLLLQILDLNNGCRKYQCLNLSRNIQVDRAPLLIKCYLINFDTIWESRNLFYFLTAPSNCYFLNLNTAKYLPSNIVE